MIFDPRDPRYDPIAAEAARLAENPNRISPFDTSRQRTPRGGSGRGGTGGGTGGTDATAEERDAVAELIEQLERELEISLEADPVRREMLRHREAMAEATDEERSRVEDLIRAEQEQSALLDSQRELYDGLRDIGYDVFDGLIRRGSTFGDVLGRVGDAILQAVLQAQLLGQGPLASLFGLGPGSGGLLGQAIASVFPSAGAAAGISRSAAIPANAEGGMVFGPGGGTSDDVLMWGSAGEFMVNARATHRYRHLLEAINSGAILPGYAAGGMIGAAPMPLPMGYGGPLVVFEDHTSGRVAIEEREETGSDGRRRARVVLADAVGDALTMPGGGARRALTQTYGVQPRRPRR